MSTLYTITQKPRSITRNTLSPLKIISFIESIGIKSHLGLLKRLPNSTTRLSEPIEPTLTYFEIKISRSQLEWQLSAQQNNAVTNRNEQVELRTETLLQLTPIEQIFPFQTMKWSVIATSRYLKTSTRQKVIWPKAGNTAGAPQAPVSVHRWYSSLRSPCVTTIYLLWVHWVAEWMNHVCR